VRGFNAHDADLQEDRYMIASRGLFRLRAAERIRAGVATATIGAMTASPVCGWAGNNTPENAGARQAPQQAPQRTAEASPLASPRSSHQVGFPAAATRAAAPADNPQTAQKVALGQKLFFDARLSADSTVACSTCHDPEHAFTDARPTSVGIKGRIGQRNAPTILNALYNKTQFWDGRAKTLEEQAAFPMVNPSEMGQPNLDAVVKSIATIGEYQVAFRNVFGQPPNRVDLLRAIASYERMLYSFDSPFDRFIAGDANALDTAAKRGWEIFNTRGRCNKCHARSEEKRDTTFFTDNDFHNIGIGIIRHDVVHLACQATRLIDSGNAAAIDAAAIQTDTSALGRFLITKKDPATAAFKTPDLRNVLMTAPYFHDGSQATLWDVVDHYNKGDGPRNPYLDEDMQPLALTETDIDDVVAFLASLTGAEYHDAGVKELERQRTLSQTTRPQRDTARAFGPKQPQPRPLRQCP
jgi:cytochrome c peroxidase